MKILRAVDPHRKSVHVAKSSASNPSGTAFGGSGLLENDETPDALIAPGAVPQALYRVAPAALFG